MLNEVRVIEFPKLLDPRGNLTYLQSPNILPFEIQRVFWTYDVPGGEIRGGHAYHTQHEIIISLSGSFDIVVKTKTGIEKTYHMNRSYFGLYIPPMIWRSMENFSTNAFSLHLSSYVYNESDYIRDFPQYASIRP
jgi:dTDP-4-dehydrorhamnose 3,5-epimerase-like enzyme